MNNRLKIAIQKSGRLHDDSIDLLKACGISIDNGKDQLKAMARNFDLEVFYLRNGDIPQYLKDGVVDIAIDNIGLAPYDIAALVPIVQEAGGKFSDRFGAQDWRANSLITTNNLLHDATLSYLPK